MTILIAPDSLKESLSSEAAAVCIGKGIHRVLPDAKLTFCPIADGGEGTTKAMVRATEGVIYNTVAHDPLRRKIKTFYGVLGDGETVVIEVAAASGLELLSKEERNPMNTTSLGTGELILAALNKGYRKFIIGLGGSAVNDCGAGILSALGAKLLDTNGNIISPVGGQLGKVGKIDFTFFDPRIKESQFIVACDVSNPLTGNTGASVVFGPQKGASPQMSELLDKNLRHFADKIKEATGIEVDHLEGAGAAGGIGAIMFSVFQAEKRKGFDVVAEAVGLDEKVKSSDLVITAEGRVDSQTLKGKTPFGVCLLGKKYKKPVFVFCGSLGEGGGCLYLEGASAIIPISNESVSLHSAIQNAAWYLENAVEIKIHEWYTRS